jgi:hypothetical protein
MRQAGEVIRTDCATYPDGSPKGNGTVVFVNAQDAKAAIGELQCRVLYLTFRNVPRV